MLNSLKMLKYLVIVCIICTLTSDSFRQITTTASSSSLQGRHNLSNIGDEYFPLNTSNVNQTLQSNSVINIISSTGGHTLHLKRNKRFVDILFGTIGVITDIIGIAQQAEETAIMEENFRDILSETGKTLDAIGDVKDTMDLMMKKSMDSFHTLQERFDQNTNDIIDEINDVGKKVDRNKGYLLEILRATSLTYTAIERSRLEMIAGFNNALLFAMSTAIKPKLTKMNNFVTYFDSQKALISQKPRGEMIAALEDDNGFLPHLRRSRTPDGDNLQSILNEIMRGQFAIPSKANDHLAYASLSSMYYGVITYISMSKYLMRANIYLADHYLRERELQNFNSQVDQMIDDFKAFRDTLIGKSGLIDQAVNIMKEASSSDFSWGNSKVDVSGWSNNLQSEKLNLIRAKLPVIQSVPEKLMVQFNFDHSLPTPVGAWEDGAKVSYAVQYRDTAGLYSKVGEWSIPFTVKGHANPLIISPAQTTYTRLIFRKFNNEEPQLVATLEREGKKTKFRDIDRDLYNAASGLHQSAAMVEAAKLINGGASTRAVFELNRRAIHAAAENGNTLLASRLLMNDASTFNTKDVNDYTPLHIAAERGWPDFVTLMLDHGLDINAKTKDGSTAMHLAVSKGHSEVVDALLNTTYSADLNAQDKSGAGPLHIAVRNGAKYMLETLLDDERTNVNLPSRGNLTPLHLSSMVDSPEITEELLMTPNIDINARSAGNLTALHQATMSRNLPALGLLAGNMGTDINAQSVNGWSPLHYAVATKERQIVAELLKVGKSRPLAIDVFDMEHTTPLHLAAASGQSEVVVDLLRSGAQIDLQNKKGSTALHLATFRNHLDTVKILLEAGANINTRTNDGSTVLHLSSSAGHVQCDSSNEGQFFLDPDDCRKFFRCNFGAPVPFQCGLGTVWKQSLLACVWPHMSNCANPVIDHR